MQQEEIKSFLEISIVKEKEMVVERYRVNSHLQNNIFKV